MPTRAQSTITTDHDEIRTWAEERGARPACVRRTGADNDIGILRLDFPGYSGADSLEEISWDDWFEKFDERGLALLHQDTTARGQKSNFNKLVSRETAKAAESGRGRSRGSARSRSTAKLSSTRRSASTSSRGRATAAKRSSRKAATRSTSRKRAGTTSRSTSRKSAASRSSSRSASGRATSTRKTGSRSAASKSRSRAKSPRTTARKSASTRSRSTTSRRNQAASRNKSNPGTSTRRTASSGSNRRTSSSTNRILTDHDEIRQWAEERNAQPACVRGTGRKKNDTGMIRLDFPGYSGAKSLQPVEWDDWFQSFDDNNLALVVQDSTSRGQTSNFNKLIGRETAGSRRGSRRHPERGSKVQAISSARGTRAKTKSTRGSTRRAA